MNIYCAYCKHFIAGKDPEKVTRGEAVFHQRCWIRKSAGEHKSKMEARHALDFEDTAFLVRFPVRTV